MISRRYTAVKAPFGALYLTAEDGVILRISPRKPPSMAAFRRDDLPVLQHAAQELTHYLCGKRTLSPLVPEGRFSAFQQDVYDAVARIPYGEAVSSSHIASAIGKPYAVRAVEMLCRENPYWILIPCHRVLLHAEVTDDAAQPLSAREALRRLEKRYAHPHTLS